MRRLGILLIGLTLGASCAIKEPPSFRPQLLAAEALAYEKPLVNQPVTATYITEFHRLMRYAGERNITVLLRPMAPEDFGASAVHNWPPVIVLNTNKGTDEQLDTLCHELAHFHVPAYLEGTLEAEVFAEAVAQLVMRAIGYDTTATSLPYLRKLNAGFDVLSRESYTIQAVATQLYRAIRP